MVADLEHAYKTQPIKTMFTSVNFYSSMLVASQRETDMPFPRVLGSKSTTTLVVVVALEVLMWSLLVRVELVLSSVLVIVHGLGVLLGLVLSLLSVYEVHTLGLCELVDLSTDKTHESLLGEGV